MTKPSIHQLVQPLSAEFPVQIIAPTNAITQEQLFVGLPADHAGRARHLELIFLPDADDVHFLQYFAPLPFKVEPKQFGEVSRLIARINASAPLIGFGFVLLGGSIPFGCSTRF